MRVRSVIAALGVLAASGLTSCGPGGAPLRLHHDTKRRLSYELEQHEEAPHPLVGLGGSLDVGASIDLACIGSEPDGSGHYEVTVRNVKLTAPADTGAAVDTKLGRPVPGDKIGANAVVMSLLPRTGVVVMDTTGSVSGAKSDIEIGKHVSDFMRTKPVAARKALYRLAETLDAGPLAVRWWNPVAALLPPNEHVPTGTTWTATPPEIDTPAGRLIAKIDVTFTREGDVAVLTGKGTFSPAGPLLESRSLDLDGASLAMTAKIDLARGVLVSYDETGRFDFRLRGEGKLAAPWAHTRKLRLVEEPTK
ncbi:MAG: DUF4815 domain-containing protein [Planctomycetes bacterium]|nr:DUF4815 domain-containing protein [Planctomycetota bacterium]